MRWLVKASVQKALAVLPAGDRLNDALQRHVARTLPAGDAAFRHKFSRALRHLDAYREHGPPRPPAGAVFYEFRAGWDLAVPVGRTVSRYHFLRFSERTWRLLTSPFNYQNRLRRPDYVHLLAEPGSRSSPSSSRARTPRTSRCSRGSRSPDASATATRSRSSESGR